MSFLRQCYAFDNIGAENSLLLVFLEKLSKNHTFLSLFLRRIFTKTTNIAFFDGL